MIQIAQDQYMDQIKVATAHLNEDTRNVARKLVLLGAKVIVHPTADTFFMFTDGVAIYYFQSDEYGKYQINKQHKPNATTGNSAGIVDGWVFDANVVALQALKIMKNRVCGIIPDQSHSKNAYRDFDEYFKRLWFNKTAIVLDLATLAAQQVEVVE